MNRRIGSDIGNDGTWDLLFVNDEYAFFIYNKMGGVFFVVLPIPMGQF